MSERVTGLKADELISVQQDPTGKATRLVFTTGAERHFLLFETAQLRTMMPQLAQATKPPGLPDLAITTTAVDMHVSGEGLGMLTLVNSVGAQMTFGLDKAQLEQLQTLVGQALSIQARLAAGETP